MASSDAGSYGTREGFLRVYEELRDELVAELPSFGMPAEVQASFREVRPARARARARTRATTPLTPLSRRRS